MRVLRRRLAALLVLILVLTAAISLAACPAGARQGNKEPVILVPGFGEGPPLMGVLAQRLKDNGNNVFPEANFLRGFIDIKLSAEKLAQRVEEVKAQTGASKVDLVGHSEGGLISRYYIERMGGAKNVDDLVTLGTPHLGTVLAYLLFVSQPARQMSPNSQFLNDLNTPDCTPGDIHCTAIYSVFDEVVVPYWNAKYPDPTVNNRKVTWFCMHIGLLFDCRVANWVNEELD